MQILQLLFVLAAVGLNVFVYSFVIKDLMSCDGSSEGCGLTAFLVMFTAPIILAISIVTLVLAQKKMASQTASAEEVKSARLIKYISIFSILFTIVPIFGMPLFIMIIELMVKLF